MARFVVEIEGPTWWGTDEIKRLVQAIMPNWMTISVRRAKEEDSQHWRDLKESTTEPPEPPEPTEELLDEESNSGMTDGGEPPRIR